MSEGILKLFVKDYKQTDNPAVRSKCAVAAGWVCIACQRAALRGKVRNRRYQPLHSHSGGRGE